MKFIKFALENNTEGRDKLPCPCYICQNLMYHKADVILNHLSKRQFDRTYTCWHRHGEKREETPSKDAQDEVTPYINRHMNLLKMQNRKANSKALATEHRKTFHIWFIGEERFTPSEVQNVDDSVDDPSTYIRRDHEEGIWDDNETSKANRSKKRRRTVEIYNLVLANRFLQQLNT
ncbi:E-selectin [Bienertia sinuspersici]